MEIVRSSGVQLHPTSLPGGRLGAEAFAFVDWLAAAGQSWWQMLPLGPPDRYGSPYRSSSAFAASPSLLAEPSAPVSQAEERDFRARHAFWIGDWERFARGRRALHDQVRFEREWTALRAPRRGARCAADRRRADLRGAGRRRPPRAPRALPARASWPACHPTATATAASCGATRCMTGRRCSRRRYRWWIERLRRTFELFDLARIDHFRGFVAYWSVPEEAPDARVGRWRRGPGDAPFAAAQRRSGDLPLIAEDLGVITPAVRRLRDRLGFPGMAVLEWAFDESSRHSPHRFENHRRHSVIYTATHDQDPIRGWWDGAGDARAPARSTRCVPPASSSASRTGV